jgi:predicted dehydrogenase
VCDTDADRAKALAAAHNVPGVYTTVQQMLDRETLDGVSVATPDHAHAQIVIRCAETGKHVLCEKPLATTVEECEAMIAAAHKHGVHLMVDWHNRWNPTCYAACKSIRDGELGEVRYIHYRLHDTIYVPTRMLPWAGRSSVLQFLGSHAIDTVCWFLDSEPCRVTCRRQSGVLTGMGLDTADTYITTLDFASGAVAVVENSWILPQSAPSLVDHRVEILGTKGIVRVNPQQCGAVEKYTEQTPGGYPHDPMPDMFVLPEVHGRQAGFAVRSIGHFVECIRDGTTPLTSGEDGLRNTRILLAAERSADVGGVPVDLEGYST